ncbi:DUF222 domain-containing protein [Nocardia otitidiscaviarum]|nr:DUF222 domain-containing protein [Nocardia otitidiscaviarum]
MLGRQSDSHGRANASRPGFGQTARLCADNTPIARIASAVSRISMAEAGARRRAAEKLGVFHFVHGEDREPELPRTAAQQAAGLLSVEHARRIMAVMDRIPAAVPIEVRDEAERLLAEHACTLHPEAVVTVGESILAHLDPDSPSLGARAIDPKTLEAAAGRDTHTIAQRNHDAVAAFLTATGGSKTLGSHRGMPVSVVLTMRMEDLERGGGHAITAAGTTMSIPAALRYGVAVLPDSGLGPTGGSLYMIRIGFVANPANCGRRCGGWRGSGVRMIHLGRPPRHRLRWPCARKGLTRGAPAESTAPRVRG